MTAGTPQPTAIRLKRGSRELQIDFDDGLSAALPFEYLRVFSPSAAVRGHGPGQEVLQTGKRDVGITDIETVGHYAIRPIFDDGHDSGLFVWGYLYELAINYQQNWQDYLERLASASASRDSD